MSKKDDYNAEEWKAIAASPVVAGLLITMSDASGPVGIAKEAVALGMAITASASTSAPEIVRSLAESVKSAGGRPELPDIPRGDRSQTRDALIKILRTATAAVERKSPAEAEPYKTWLVSVATGVSQASKEGGFLGFGGDRVSVDEQEALKQLAGTLGVKAPAVAR
jgi:hypothetical protein